MNLIENPGLVFNRPGRRQIEWMGRTLKLRGRCRIQRPSTFSLVVEGQNLTIRGSVLGASWVTNATRRESIKLTQRFAAVSASVSQEQPHTYTSSWTSRLLRRAPVRSVYVIDEEQNPGDPPPRPHLPTLAAFLHSESDMGRLNGEYMILLFSV